eukprot:scaffold208346_cov16-Tisochrysis_lutea.AAC.1
MVGRLNPAVIRGGCKGAWSGTSGLTFGWMMFFTRAPWYQSSRQGSFAGLKQDFSHQDFQHDNFAIAGHDAQPSGQSAAL